MVRKLSENFIKREDILQLLNLPKSTQAQKNDLLLQAFEKNLITQDEFRESLNTRVSTIPCYLHTHIENPTARELLEKYVQAYSLLYTRGSWLANLACIEASRSFNIPEEFPTSETVVSIPSFLTNENLLKHCFLPERWILKQKPIDPLVFEAYELHKNSLECLLPKYGDIMSDCGWDNAINNWGTSYLGNIKVQVCFHLLKRLKTYILDHYPANQFTNKRSLWHSIHAPLSPNSEIHEVDYEWAMNVRTSLRCDKESWLNPPSDLDNYVWTLHLWLVKKLRTDMEKSASFLPVSPLSRKYVYIDEKVLNSLFPTKLKKQMLELTKEHEGSQIQKLLGLTRKLFNKRRSKLRREIKKKYKASNNDKMKKKWSKLGHSCLPKDARVKMVRTDGVGLRICLEFIPTLQELKTSYKQSPPKEDPMFEDPFHCAADTGRVRILTSMNDDGNVQMITRKAYYRFQRHERALAFEETRMKGTPWGVAIAKISQAGGFRNIESPKWQATMEQYRIYKDILIQEQVIDKTRALAAMRRYRWKRAFIDQNLKKIFKPAIEKKRAVVFGIGDGDFSSCGRGELAVPTTAISIGIKRVLRTHRCENLVKIRKVCEHNTTKCCYKCHSVMEKLITKFGRECLRYRVCTNCTETIGKRRNRDTNASKNLHNLLRLEYAGLPRPEAFLKPSSFRSKK